MTAHDESPTIARLKSVLDTSLSKSQSILRKKQQTNTSLISTATRVRDPNATLYMPTRRLSDNADSGRGYVAKLDRREASRMSKGQPVEDEISEKVDGFVTYLKHKKWGLKETRDFLSMLCVKVVLEYSN